MVGCVRVVASGKWAFPGLLSSWMLPFGLFGSGLSFLQFALLCPCRSS